MLYKEMPLHWDMQNKVFVAYLPNISIACQMKLHWFGNFSSRVISSRDN